MDAATALFANDSFYLAFSHRDIAALELLWACEHPVICIHPGWRVLTDRAEIIASWRAILNNPAAGMIVPHYARTFDYGRCTLVVCYEELQGQMLAATNIFVEEEGAVRMVMHQASACADPPAPEAKPPPAWQ